MNMHEKLPIDTSGYLGKIEKKKFEISEEWVRDSLERLRKPFDQIVSKGDNSVEIDVGEAKLEVQYRRVDAQTREIVKIIFQLKDQDIDLFSLLPSQTRIFVSQVDLGRFEKGVATYLLDHEEYVITLQQEINSPEALSFLLHEVGHVIDYKKLYNLNMFSLMSDHPDARATEEVRRERAANAFALKVLRPYLKDETMRQDVQNLLINDSLRSYYDGVRSNRNIGKKNGPDLGLNENEMDDLSN